VTVDDANLELVVDADVHCLLTSCLAAASTHRCASFARHLSDGGVDAAHAPASSAGSAWSRQRSRRRLVARGVTAANARQQQTARRQTVHSVLSTDRSSPAHLRHADTQITFHT